MNFILLYLFIYFILSLYLSFSGISKTINVTDITTKKAQTNKIQYVEAN